MNLLGESFERGRVYSATYVDVYRCRVPGSGSNAGYSGHLLVVSWCSWRRRRRRRGIRHCGRRGRRTAWRQQSERDTFDISHHQALFLLYEAFSKISPRCFGEVVLLTFLKIVTLPFKSLRRTF